MTRVLRGENGADFGWDARGFSGDGVNGDPEGARLGEEGVIAAATHLGEAFEGDTRGLTDPGAQDDLVAKAGGRFVVDLMT